MAIHIDDRVYGHDPLRGGVQFVQVFDACFLKRHRNGASADSKSADPADGRADITSCKGLIDKIQAQFTVQKVMESGSKISRTGCERHAKLRVFVNMEFHKPVR